MIKCVYCTVLDLEFPARSTWLHVYPSTNVAESLWIIPLTRERGC